ncbi:MAG: NACHT domain-containing protein, partial [Gammaproteobacteria bacterium]|nr:NACHT domain-containing protein [Gammaproteobacteria bacterium]
MIYERLRVFVSSRMQELAPERAAIKAALNELNIDGWVFEEDAGARAQAIQQSYKEEIDSADLYIGLFWRDYGDYTIDEFDYAGQRNKDRLIYEKRADIDGQRDPKLQTFLDQIGKVETGLTPRWFNTPEELREGVKPDAARWLTRKIRELRELNVSYQPSPLDAGEQRDLKILLGKVKHFWIEGVLENTIRRAGLLELGKDTQPQAVENPWEAVLELPFEGTRAVASGKSISDVFDDVERSVLILGQPGSGKTTTLLTLVRELLMRAERQPAQPIPVVFHLSSWVDPKQSLDTWLVDELSDKYQIPKKIGKDWLEHQRLLLLLDGLDEVKGEHRAACVEAINRYGKETGLPGMVVCCRLEQYEELPVKLTLNGAICLRPLTDAQIDAYVEEAGAELAGLRTALRQDRVLQELARSPLMLNLMCLAYRGYGAENLAGLETPQDRTKHLFTTYIDLMFKKRGKAALAYPRERTLGWLSWLARRLSERNQAMFLIEDLQPGWLTNGSQRWMYLAVFSLVVGLLLGFVNIAYYGAGYYDRSYASTQKLFLQPGEWIAWLTALPLWLLVFGWIEGFGSSSGRPLLEHVASGIQRAAVKGLVSASLWSLVAWAAVAILCFLRELPFDLVLLQHLLWNGVAFALLAGAMGRNRSIYYSINTVESLRWSLGNAWQGAILGLLGGLLVGSALPFLSSLGDRWWIPFLGFAIVGLGIGGILGGLKPHVLQTK